MELLAWPGVALHLLEDVGSRGYTAERPFREVEAHDGRVVCGRLAKSPEASSAGAANLNHGTRALSEDHRDEWAELGALLHGTPGLRAACDLECPKGQDRTDAQPGEIDAELSGVAAEYLPHLHNQ